MTTEEKIIIAAINCIEKYGYESATIRQIAAEAGVNSAAISYYFRSKDVLMRLALEQGARNGFNMEDFSFAADLPLEDRLFEIFDFFVKKLFEYPNLTRALLFDTVMHGKYDSFLVSLMNKFFQELTQDILQKDPSLREQSLKTALTQITAASFIYCATTPRLLETYNSIDFEDTDMRGEYLRKLIHQCMRPVYGAR